eukprot:449465_1
MSDLINPLVSEDSHEFINSHDQHIHHRNRYISNSDEWESTRKLTSSSNGSITPYSKFSYSSYHSNTSTHTHNTIDNLNIHITNSSTHTDIDTLPEDVFSDEWQTILDFDSTIDDKTLCKKIKNKSYHARALQLQSIIECLPKSIALEIISYELSSHSVETFVRRSIAYSVLKKVDIKAYISGWILTFIGIYLCICGLNLFGLFPFIPNNIAIYIMGNYTGIGSIIELTIVLLLCSIHFSCIIGVYHDGRKWNKKLNRVKHVLKFKDAENCGEVYIPVLRWLGFPFIEAFNVDIKWFMLIGFKYWIMTVIFIILCLPFWIYEEHWVWLIISIPACILCCIGAWLQMVTFQNINDLWSACKNLIKIVVMCIIVFAIFFGIIWLMQTSPPPKANNRRNGNTIKRLINGDFDILNIALAGIFIIVLICMELRIIHSWKSVNVRYHYFGWQLLASILIVMIFGVLGLNIFLYIGALLVLYNAAVIWNDLMHKKIMQTTYGLNKTQYVNKYRPIYNTDKDSEWLTYIFRMCLKDNCISKCRGRWVINCYAGLITGKITSPTYLL